MLESLNKEIHLKDLVFSKPTEQRINLEEELQFSLDDIEMMKEFLLGFELNSEWGNWGQEAVAIKTCGLEKEFPSIFSDYHWEVLTNNFFDPPAGTGIHTLANRGYVAKMLFPERFVKIKISQSLKNQLLSFTFQQSFGIELLDIARDVKILFPDFDLKPLLTSQRWENLISDAQSLASQGMVTISKRIADIRLCDPESFKQMTIPQSILLQEVNFLNELRAARNPYYDPIITFPIQAANLKIISAKEVNLTEKGIEIIPPDNRPSFNQPENSLPIRRKF